MEFGLWLPVYGGWLRVSEPRPRPTFGLCREAARCAESSGFKYLYASENYLNCVYGPDYPVADVWIYLSAIAACTRSIRLVGGTKPGFLPPFVFANMVSSLDWVSDGRAAVNIVCGWWKQEFETCGVDMLDHDGRYRRAAEYVHCIKGLWTERSFSFSGEHYHFKDSILGARPRQLPHPPLWISGHSDSAIRLAATEGDVLFLNGMPLQQLSPFIRRVKSFAAADGRALRVAVNAFILLEETDSAAQARHYALLANRDRELIGTFRTAMDESGAAVWSDLNETQMVDTNAGFETGLIGSADSIAAQLEALQAAGVDIVMCQFEDVRVDLQRFGSRILRATGSAKRETRPQELQDQS